MSDHNCGDNICGDNICAYHEDRNKVIEALKQTVKKDIMPKVEQQAGQWKILLWCLAGFGTVMMSFAVVSYNQQKEQIATTTKIDKTITAYMAGNVQLHAAFERRIAIAEEEIRNNRARLRALEIQRAE